MNGTKSFALLSFAGGHATSTPTWAPKWDRPAIYARHETQFDDYLSDLVEFPGQEMFAFSLSESSKILHASGVFVGEIIKAYEIPPLETSQDGTYRYLRNASILQEFEERLGQDSAFDGYRELSFDGKSTVIAHVFEGHRFSWTWSSDVERYDALLERSSPASESPEAKSYYATALTLVTKGDSSIFATASGSIGRTFVGPNGDGAKTGDRIALFPGCAWPIHLRPLDNNYRVLGPCYLHGFMSIEAHMQIVAQACAENEKELNMIPLV